MRKLVFAYTKRQHESIMQFHTYTQWERNEKRREQMGLGKDCDSMRFGNYLFAFLSRSVSVCVLCYTNEHISCVSHTHTTTRISRSHFSSCFLSLRLLIVTCSMSMTTTQRVIAYIPWLASDEPLSFAMMLNVCTMFYICSVCIKFFFYVLPSLFFSLPLANTPVCVRNVIANGKSNVLKC